MAIMQGLGDTEAASAPLSMHPRHEYALDLMLCMPSQHHAIGLQTDCMVLVPWPMLRLPDSHLDALWP